MRFSLRPLVASLALLAAATVHAAAPDYSQVIAGPVVTGTVQADSHLQSDQWSFWTFQVGFLEEASFQIDALNPDLDLVVAIWYGLEADTADYFDLTSGGIYSVFVTGADNTYAGGSEVLNFTNIYGNERFVLGIADYSDGVGSSPLAVQITSSVPEPESAALFLAGLGLLAAARRRA